MVIAFKKLCRTPRSNGGGGKFFKPFAFYYEWSPDNLIELRGLDYKTDEGEVKKVLDCGRIGFPEFMLWEQEDWEKFLRKHIVQYYKPGRYLVVKKGGQPPIQLLFQGYVGEEAPK